MSAAPIVMPALERAANDRLKAHPTEAASIAAADRFDDLASPLNVLAVIRYAKELEADREVARRMSQALSALLAYHDDVAKAADQRLLDAGYEALAAFNKS